MIKGTDFLESDMNLLSVEANLVIFKSIASSLSSIYHKKGWCNFKNLYMKDKAAL